MRQVILDRIATHGTVETMVSTVNDTSRRLSVSAKLGLKFGLGGKQLTVHKSLVSATFQRGALVGKRLDCVRDGEELQGAQAFPVIGFGEQRVMREGDAGSGPAQDQILHHPINAPTRPVRT